MAKILSLFFFLMTLTIPVSVGGRSIDKREANNGNSSGMMGAVSDTIYVWTDFARFNCKFRLEKGFRSPPKTMMKNLSRERHRKAVLRLFEHFLVQARILLV